MIITDTFVHGLEMEFAGEVQRRSWGLVVAYGFSDDREVMKVSRRCPVWLDVLSPGHYTVVCPESLLKKVVETIEKKSGPGSVTDITDLKNEHFSALRVVPVL